MDNFCVTNNQYEITCDLLWVVQLVIVVDRSHNKWNICVTLSVQDADDMNKVTGKIEAQRKTKEVQRDNKQ